jgi:hypothetical protein
MRQTSDCSVRFGDLLGFGELGEWFGNAAFHFGFLSNESTSEHEAREQDRCDEG